MPREETLRHLKALYAGSPDPWAHWRRLYERRKLDRTAAAAGRGPFRLTVELGCGSGALTRRLARRSRCVLAMDGVPEALAAAARRGGGSGIEFRLALVPRDLPPVRPDLVVLSELLYFLTPQDIDALARWLRARATPRTRIVVVNWTGRTGELLDGRRAAERLARGLSRLTRRRTEAGGYVLDIYSMPRRRSAPVVQRRCASSVGRSPERS